MEKVYVIYEVREENFKEANNLGSCYDIIKIFKNINNAITYLKNEIYSQCDNDTEWNYRKSTNEKISVEFYYYDDLQYTMSIKEMEVE